MGDVKEKSFEYAKDVIKLIMTLATGLVGFSTTFVKDIIGTTPISHKPLLLISWIILFISIVFCIWTIMGIAGSLSQLEKNISVEKKDKIDIYNRNIIFPAVGAIMSFLIGVLVYIFFTVQNF